MTLGQVVLSHCPDLQTSRVSDADGSSWVLIGLAIQTEHGRMNPEQEIAAARTRDVADLRHNWTGRWALLGAGEVHLDAAGMIGVLIARDSQSRTWCSSSPVLAVAASGQAPAPDPRMLRYERGISWYTPPLSCDRGLRRLLPSEVLDPATGQRAHRRLMPPIDPVRPASDILDEMASGLVTAMNNVPNGAKPVWIGLSAGADSRVVLAAVIAAGIPAKTFSWIAPRTSLADRLLPPKLADAAGLEHMVLRAGPMIPSRGEMALAHAGSNVAKGDAEPMFRGVRDPLTGSSTGGQCFAVGKAKMRKLPETIEDPHALAKLIAFSSHEPSSSSATQGHRLWLEWAQLTPEPNLDWRDRYYIEQRVAGWQCAKEQLYDMYLLQRWPLINSGRLYSLMLSLPEPLRRSGSHQMDLVARLSPGLASFPTNPPATALVGRIPALLDKLTHPGQIARRAKLRVAHAAARFRR